MTENFQCYFAKAENAKQHQTALKEQQFTTRFLEKIARDKKKLAAFGELGILKRDARESVRLLTEIEKLCSMAETSGEIGAYVSVSEKATRVHKLANKRYRETINEIFGSSALENAYKYYRNWKKGFLTTKEQLSLAKIALIYGVSPRELQNYVEYQDRTTVRETAPPGMEDWILKNKPQFKDRYGKDWERVLYSTAWQLKKDTQESINEVVVLPKADNIGDISFFIDSIFQIVNDRVQISSSAKIKKITGDYDLVTVGAGQQDTIVAIISKTALLSMGEVEDTLESTVISNLQSPAPIILGMIQHSQSPIPNGREINVLYVPDAYKTRGIWRMLYQQVLSSNTYLVSGQVQDATELGIWKYMISNKKEYAVLAFDANNPNDLASVWINKAGEIKTESLDTVKDSIFYSESLYSAPSIRLMVKKQ